MSEERIYSSMSFRAANPVLFVGYDGNMVLRHRCCAGYLRKENTPETPKEFQVGSCLTRMYAFAPNLQGQSRRK